MKVIHSSEETCEKTRKYLDYYLSNELSIEASLQLARHLGRCQSCLTELQQRMRLKDRLRRAVLETPVSPRLRELVVKKLRQSGGAL